MTFGTETAVCHAGISDAFEAVPIECQYRCFFLLYMALGCIPLSIFCIFKPVVRGFGIHALFVHSGKLQALVSELKEGGVVSRFFSSWQFVVLVLAGLTGTQPQELRAPGMLFPVWSLGWQSWQWHTQRLDFQELVGPSSRSTIDWARLTVLTTLVPAGRVPTKTCRGSVPAVLRNLSCVLQPVFRCFGVFLLFRL